MLKGAGRKRHLHSGWHGAVSNFIRTASSTPKYTLRSDVIHLGAVYDERYSGDCRPKRRPLSDQRMRRNPDSISLCAKDYSRAKIGPCNTKTHPFLNSII